jgi:nucleotide-binding universal stress UspA family protein
MTTNAAEGQADLRGRVVVGYDGSPGARAALDWAAREAASRCVPLLIVCCSVPAQPTDFSGTAARGADVVQAAAAELRARFAGLEVSVSVTAADPRDALVAEEGAGDVLVVGASTSGALERALLGSVPRLVARRTRCPLVVHRAGGRQPAQRIVVAVDGSPTSNGALELAADLATRDDAELVLVHVWKGQRGRGRSRLVDRQTAQGVLDDAELRCHGLDVELRSALVEGDPAEVIRNIAHDADMIVVGTRGRSALRTRLVGSVAQALTQDAPCTVVVVPPARATGD